MLTIITERAGYKMYVNEIIYQFWTGNNPITENRIKCLKSNINIGIKTVLVTPQNMYKFIHPQYPIHPAYNFLSNIHRSDYLRCYFMHILGGGYADIKFYTKNNNWRDAFNLINTEYQIQIIGEKEDCQPLICGNLPCTFEEGMKRCIRGCFYIARPFSDFTQIWFNNVNHILDYNYQMLKQYPANTPFGRDDDKYPLRWDQILGEVMTKLQYEFYESHPNSVNQSLHTGVDFSFNHR